MRRAVEQQNPLAPRETCCRTWGAAALEALGIEAPAEGEASCPNCPLTPKPT